MTEQKRALVLIADGSEEMEAVITVDVLRRADIQVTMASVNGSPVVCARNTKLLPDIRLQDMKEPEIQVFLLD
jgi:protein DJ-1